MHELGQIPKRVMQKQVKGKTVNAKILTSAL